MIRRRAPRPTSKPRATATTTAEPAIGAALVPVPKFDKPDPSIRGGVPLGTLLENARRRAMLTEEGAANLIRISVNEVFDFESGLRTPSDNLLEIMADVYGTSVDRLRSNAGADIDGGAGPAVMNIGWAQVDIEDATDVERLQRIAATFRAMRNIDEHAAIVIRDDEIEGLSRGVKTIDHTLIDHLIQIFGCDRERAIEVVARMSYHATARKELGPAGAPAGLDRRSSADSSSPADRI